MADKRASRKPVRLPRRNHNPNISRDEALSAMPAIDLTLDFWQCATEAASVAALVSTLPPPPSLPSAGSAQAALNHHPVNGTSSTPENDTSSPSVSARRRSILGAPPPAPSSTSSSTANVPMVALRRRSSVAIDHAADAIPKVVRRHSRGSLLQSGIAGPIGGAGGTRAPKRPPSERDPVVVQADTIMADILALASYLHHIRRAYLGTVARLPTGAFATSASSVPLNVMGVELPLLDNNLTAAERDQIDQLVAMVLGQANTRIKQLSALIDREHQLLEADKSSTSGLLARFMGGAPAETTGTRDEEPDQSADPKHLHAQAMLTHYSSMVWVLNQLMFRVTNEHRRLHERRVERDLDRLALDTSATNTSSTSPPDEQSTLRRRPVATTSSESFLAAASASIGLPTAATTSAASTGTGISNLPSASAPAPPQMIQEFEAENKELLEMFESKLDEVKTAETSLLAIAQLQTELAQHMAVQQSQIESLVDDAVVHVANVRAGNVELTKAREYGKTARFWFLFIMLVVSATLLFLDWYAG